MWGFNGRLGSGSLNSSESRPADHGQVAPELGRTGHRRRGGGRHDAHSPIPGGDAGEADAIAPRVDGERGAMTARRGLMGVVGIVVTLVLWLGAAGAASASYSVNPSCTAATQTSGCSSAWYTSPVQVLWSWSPNDGGTAVSGCVTQSVAQDIRMVASCTVTGPSGTTGVDQPINLEMSNPTAGALPSRPPDSNGWYNHAVAISFTGSAFSGIALCTSPITFAGPDRSGVSVAGSCTDNAGKVASAGVALNYDATPPTISRATPSRPPNNHGWYNRPVSFAFSAADATSGLSGCSNPTYTGPNTASASVTGTCLDRAGNVAARSVPLHYDASPPALGASVDDR